jgi:hypothetical protein
MFNDSMFIVPGGMSKSVEALIAESRITEILGS